MYRCNLLRHQHIQGSTIQQSQFTIWEGTSNQRRHSSTRSLQRVTHQWQKKALSKAKLSRLLRTNSSNKTFEENITTFKKHLTERCYLKNFINNTLPEVKFQEMTQALLQRNKTKKRILPFVTQYHPAVPNLKEILTRKWYLIQQHPLLYQIFKEPPMISYWKGRSLKIYS